MCVCVCVCVCAIGYLSPVLMSSMLGLTDASDLLNAVDSLFMLEHVH